MINRLHNKTIQYIFAVGLHIERAKSPKTILCERDLLKLKETKVRTYLTELPETRK